MMRAGKLIEAGLKVGAKSLDKNPNIVPTTCRWKGYLLQVIRLGPQREDTAPDLGIVAVVYGPGQYSTTSAVQYPPDRRMTLYQHTYSLFLVLEFARMIRGFYNAVTDLRRGLWK